MQTEQAVAQRVGISRDDCLRMRRKMRKGTHWVVEPDVGVVFTDEGVAALGKMLHLAEPTLEIVKEKEGPRAELAAIALKTDYPNRHMILAEVDGKRARCRVRSADMYVPRMAFAAYHIQDDLYEETRAPRFRGRA